MKLEKKKRKVRQYASSPVSQSVDGGPMNQHQDRQDTDTGAPANRHTNMVDSCQEEKGLPANFLQAVVAGALFQGTPRGATLRLSTVDHSNIRGFVTA